jgi:alanine-glyoxylate transaminase/serine-glyoxylate transaminase/serine-pyruvate transaminase
MMALAGAEMTMRDVGMDIVPGSGVAAAEEYYRSTFTGAEARPATPVAA